ncbi:MAG: hypothetical protein ACK4NP_05670 [Parvularculaceae bacterium]
MPGADIYQTPSKGALRPDMPQTPTPEPLNVHDLQALAVEAAVEQAASSGRKARSRAANLHLIDLLSRWGGSGLAIFAAAAIFITVVIGRDYPLRAWVWAAMVFAALYLCRRYRKEFRRGDRIAARPFRWRAYYTSTLAVVSAAFGAGAFLLAVPATSQSVRFEILAAMVIGSLAASAFNVAHRLAALAAALPASAFLVAAALRIDGLSLAPAALTAILAAGVSALWISSSIAATAADRKFPRTGLVRREIKPAAAQQPAAAAAAIKAAAKA